MLEDLIVTTLCTSFPVDFLIRTLDYDARFPAKFVPHYADTYANLYDHPNALRLGAAQQGGINIGTGSPSELPRFSPTPFPSYKQESLPSHVYDKIVSPPVVDLQVEFQRPTKRSTEKPKEGVEGQPEEETESDLESSEEELALDSTAGSLRPPKATKLQKLFQDQMVVVVEDAIQQPTPDRIKKRMHELLSQMRALTRAINLLMTCEPLRVLSVEYRLTISRKGFSVGSDQDRTPSFVLEHLTYPYLFMATLQVNCLDRDF